MKQTEEDSMGRRVAQKEKGKEETSKKIRRFCNGNIFPQQPKQNRFSKIGKWNKKPTVSVFLVWHQQEVEWTNLIEL